MRLTHRRAARSLGVVRGNYTEIERGQSGRERYIVCGFGGRESNLRAIFEEKEGGCMRR